nr:MAG TPA_asm: hypothetical protein [Caudoviricetes sp.]
MWRAFSEYRFLRIPLMLLLPTISNRVCMSLRGITWEL